MSPEERYSKTDNIEHVFKQNDPGFEKGVRAYFVFKQLNLMDGTSITFIDKSPKGFRGKFEDPSVPFGSAYD